MKIQILAFGIAKEILGGREVAYELAGEPTVSNLLQSLEKTYPRLVGLASIRIAVNTEYADDDTPIGPTDEVLIPPVSGG
jgi:molybdopterin synthase sulfur carrier subunit